MQPVEQVARIRANQTQDRVRVGLSERRHQRNGDDVRDRRRQADRDLAAKRRIDVRSGSAEFVEFGDDPRRVLERLAPAVRQHHASPVAGEKRDPQFFFEHPHLAAERRLRDAHAVRGFAETAEFGHVDEGSELRKFHSDTISAYLFTRKNLRLSPRV